MPTKSDLISTRAYKDTDKNFILATFLRGLYHGKSGWAELIPKRIFMDNYHDIAEALLSYPTVKINIACLKEDPEVILGYSIIRNVNLQVVLDWVYVKEAWRKIGIAKSLVPEKFDAVTHLTAVGKSLKPKNCDYNPFLL